MWGGADEENSVQTIIAALEEGINLVDTAPVYGFGRAEKIVGRALREHNRRAEVFISTKACLAWKNGRVFRNATRGQIKKDLENSLRRLGTDYIDIYFVHWPDPLVPAEETAEAMRDLFYEGKIRAVGVSNYSTAQMAAFEKYSPLHISQPPYNLFERGIEAEEMEYCRDRNIALMTYGALCRGLLSGRMTASREFAGDDLRNHDPKFHGERFRQYLSAADKLAELAWDRYSRGLHAMAVRWVLDQGADIAIWGARRPEQITTVRDAVGWIIADYGKRQIKKILDETLHDPVGPEFMAPPVRDLRA
jgi:aryl-alcohol dehydrogenase-like predicted oxidoreductase